MPLYYESGCLSFNAIVDAIFSSAVQSFDFTPCILDITTDARSIYITMPYLGASVYAMSKAQRKKHALQILGDIAKACLDMEKIGLQHTDIKHANILVTKSGDVSLIDFNICSIKHVNANGIWSPNLGTWEYASPEICLLTTPTNTSVVWSLGILLCFLISEHPLQALMDCKGIDSGDRTQWMHFLRDLSKDNSIGLPMSNDVVRELPFELRKLFHECTYWDPLKRISLKDFYVRIASYKEYDVRPFVKVPKRFFTMIPKPSDMRNHDLDTMYKWCENTEQLYLLCRSIAIYDRISFYAQHDWNAPGCLAISYMLIGNYVYFEDPHMEMMVRMFDIDNWDKFLKHIIEICIGLEWDIYELSADVMLLEYIDNLKDIQPMLNTIFAIQKAAAKEYTMRGIKSQFHKIVKGQLI